MPYQYKILEKPNEDTLTDLGLDGWEIVQVVIVGSGVYTAAIVYMKQEVGVETAQKLKVERKKAGHQAAVREFFDLPESEL